MKTLLSSVIAMVFAIQTVSAQDTTITVINTRDKEPQIRTAPYTTKFRTDAPIIVGGLGLTIVGVKLINDRPDLTAGQVAAESREKVWFLDRGNVGYYDEKIDEASYIPFKASFALPVVMALLNGNERNRFGQVMVLYTETMAITGALFTLSAGLVDRSRPYVYGANTPMDKRMGKTGQRSFYAGHTAATAAATFFAAQTFADFNPDSKLKPVIWVIAAATPALVGYQRYKAGMHFLSDNLLGYAMGAAAGILVPKLHRTKMMQNVTIAPNLINGSKGISIVYNIK